MRALPTMLTCLLFLTALATVPSATAYQADTLARAVDAQPSQELCDIAMTEAFDEFSLYVTFTQNPDTGAMDAQGEVPPDVAAVHSRSMYNSCFEKDESLGLNVGKVTAIVDTVAEVAANTEVCSGGGSSIIGMRTWIELLGYKFPVAPSPGSSYWTVYEDGSGGHYGVGHTNGAVNTFEGAGDENGAGGYFWWFSAIPMGGTVDLGWNCLGPLITSHSIGTSGTRLGLPTFGVFEVQWSGTTCLLPC